MTTLLHLSASPRGAKSESLAIARTFLQTLADERPDIHVDDWDLWDGSLPAFGADAAAGKYAVFAGAEHTTAEAKAWADVRRTFERFADADAYLFSVPMWNHGIPYVLKQFIDVVSQPGLLYGFDSEAGYTGLVTGKQAIAIYTSGIYGEGRAPEFGVDFQQPYLDSWLRWAGVTDIETVSFRPNLVTADPETGRREAHAAARRAALELQPVLPLSA